MLQDYRALGDACLVSHWRLMERKTAGPPAPLALARSWSVDWNWEERPPTISELTSLPPIAHSQDQTAIMTIVQANWPFVSRLPELRVASFNYSLRVSVGYRHVIVTGMPLLS